MLCERRRRRGRRFASRRGEERYLVGCSSVRSRVRWEIIKDAGLWRWKPNIFAVGCIDHPGDDRIRGRIELEFEVIEVRRHSLAVSTSCWSSCAVLIDRLRVAQAKGCWRCLMRCESTREEDKMMNSITKEAKRDVRGGIQVRCPRGS